MAKLTTSQVALKLNVSVYTIKRWYKWFETEDPNKLAELVKQGMPLLPKYELIGNTYWRYWDEADLPKLQAFKDYIPHTKGGFMGSLNKKGNK